MSHRTLPARRTALAAAIGAIAAALAALAFAPDPAAAQLTKQKKASFVLNADRSAYEPGTTIRLAALVSIDRGWHVNSHKPTFEYLIATVLDVETPAGWPQETVQYPIGVNKSFAFANQPLSVYDGDLIILTEIKVPSATPHGAVPVKASLHYQACNESQCLPPVTAEAKIELKVGKGGALQHPEIFAKAKAAMTAPPASGGDAGKPGGPGSPVVPARGLLATLLLAVLGGLILNAMPCVLPVLSLKVFGLVRTASHGRGEVTRGSLATAAGILVSFWALAGAAVAARSAGLAVGWGVQFQQPGFVTFLAVVVVLFCLNLWGLFEISLPQWLMRAGSTGPTEGVAGHFASGLFASLMATPCSAPFLGTAIGFALGQTAGIIFLIFTALGLGMALPYLLIALAPGVARFLPKPGNWMETVRGMMGFLLAASAVWLFFVLSSQISPDRLALIQLSLLGLALFVWLRHRTQGSAGKLWPRLATLAAAGAVAAGLFVAIGQTGSATASPLTSPTAGLIAWQAFDRGRAESLANGGQLVFVDVTANWCVTCKVNEQLVLDTPEVAAAFKEHEVIPMKADWTNRNEEIGKLLAEHGRYGIPFYMLYRPGADPHVFSEVPSKAALVAVVQAAGAGRAAL